MRQLTNEEGTALETLIDQCGLSNVLLAIGQIAGAKAEHIASNWQDTGLSKAWERAGNHVDRLALHRVIADVS